MILALLKLTRPQYPVAIAAGFLAVLAYLSEDGFSSIGAPEILAALALMFVVCGSYALNDVIDVEADKVNAPNRPLPAGRIRRQSALAFSIVLYFTGLAFSRFTVYPYMITLLIVAVVSVLYDISGKRIGVWKEVLVALLMSSIYPLGFAFSGNLRSSGAGVLRVHFFWLFLTSLAFEMLKDIRDIKGDAAAGGNCRSYRSALHFLLSARIITFAASLLTLLPFALGLCGYIYLVSACCAVVLAGVSAFCRPAPALYFIYAETVAVLAGSAADLCLKV